MGEQQGISARVHGAGPAALHEFCYDVDHFNMFFHTLSPTSPHENKEAPYLVAKVIRSYILLVTEHFLNIYRANKPLIFFRSTVELKVWYVTKIQRLVYLMPSLKLKILIITLDQVQSDISHWILINARSLIGKQISVSNSYILLHCRHKLVVLTLKS